MMCFFSAADVMIWENMLFKRKLELIFRHTSILRLDWAKKKDIFNVNFYCVLICDNGNRLRYELKNQRVLKD
jgi:hypothetical protein